MIAYPLLNLEKLRIRHRGQDVLAEIDWTIGIGEQWAILGPNGSGKTTLVKTLAGQLPAAGGNISFYPPDDGESEQTSTKTAIEFVSAELHRRVFDRDAFAEEIRHFSGDDRKALTTSDFILDRSQNNEQHSPGLIKELETFCDQFGMRSLLNKRVAILTTGEISKILILKALLHRPQLLILDEPFSGLDRRNRQAMAKIIGKMTRKGMHLILITHCIDEIVPEISHVLLMNANGIQKAGRKEEVLQSHVLRQVYNINHTPLYGEPILPLRPSNPSWPLFSDWECANGTQKGTKLVEMIDVKVQYDKNTVLENVDWTIRKGENWIVSGADGAGKTSLLKLITGENLQSYANDIYLFGQKKGGGESIWEIKKRIGWISSDLHSKFPVNIKGIHVVCSGFFDSVGLYRHATNDQLSISENMLKALGIDKLGKETYGRLSHGQKQMLLIARAIVKFPPMLLFDEPCEGLDFANRSIIYEMINFICRHTPTAIVYATYDDANILPCFTHRLHLKRGKAKISIIKKI